MKKIIILLALFIGLGHAEEQKTIVNEIPFQLVYGSDDGNTLVRSYIGSPIITGKLEYYDGPMYGSTFSFVIDKSEAEKMPNIQSYYGDFKPEFINFDSDLSAEEVKQKAEFFGMSMKLVESKFVVEQGCAISAPAVIQLSNINYVAYMDSETFLTGDFIRVISHGKYQIICDQFAEME